MTPATRTATPPRPRHWAALGVAVGLTLAAHAWLLMAAPHTAHTASAAARTVQVQVRPALPAPAAPPLQDAAPQAQGPSVARTQVTPQALARAAAVVETAASATPTPTTTTPTPTTPGTEATAPADQAPPLPTYSTQLAPAATLHYELRRNALVGQATLHWQPTDSGYQVSLQGRIGGLPAVEGVSQGGFDAAGIAPLRYSESRRGRELRAANFQRGAGRITYSGPAVEHPLVPGAQDRLSWLVQLGAVLQANPALAQPGAQVAMLVAGSRGDALPWTFAVQGMEAVTLPDDSVVQALHLHRAPQRPYDNHVDVWLDPSRHHLPVRLRLQLRATGEGTDYRLQRLELP